MIDAHCHLDFARFDDDRDAVLAAGRAAGVGGWIVAGVDPDGWKRQAALEAARSDIRCCFGLHPVAAAMLPPGELDGIMAQLATTARFAIGETGLDGSKYAPRGTLEPQTEAFRAHLALAREMNLPIVLHVLGAHGAALEVLEQDGAPEAGGLVHSYSGAAPMVRAYERHGMYISFSGSITHPTARRVLEAVRTVSPDRLLIETDCPDQRPHGVVGGRNLPEWLGLVAERVAAVRDEPVDEVKRRTAENARRLFGLEASWGAV